MSEIKLQKKHLVIVFLIIFLMLGLYLRLYHIDFPKVGYHNMKENEYLDQAYFFSEKGNWLHKQAFAFYGLDEGTGYHEEYGQVPIVPYLAVGLWSVFGESVWIVRLFMVFFMLGSILVSYLIVQRLTKNTFLSLLTSFLVTIMPLGIFFGRNVQPEPPALFFMLLGTYFYLLWTNSLSKKHLLYASLFVGIAAIFKVTFLIVFIPWLFVFPYKAIFSNFRKKKSQFISKVVYFIIGLLPFLILRILFEVTIVDKDKGNFVFHFSDLLSSAFWAKRTPILKSFLADNFTWWFVTFAIIGLVFCLIKYRSKFSRFMIGFAISIPIYIAIVSAKIAGHSYYQMPFLFLVCALSAYFIYIIGSTLSSLTKVKWLLYVVLAILLFTIPSLDAANDRVWDTNFYGQDVIGGYIESQTISSDRMVTFSHSQTLAVCSYAHRRCGSIYNTTHLQRVEDIFNVNFIYVDAAYLNKLHNHKAFEYIQKNYKIDLVGAFKIGNSQLIPTAFLLRKGGTYNLTEVEQKQGHFAKEYTRRTSDPAQFFIIKND